MAEQLHWVDRERRPWRTPKTPALGRGCSSTAATSPAAKTAAQLVEASVGCTALVRVGVRVGLG